MEHEIIWKYIQHTMNSFPIYCPSLFVLVIELLFSVTHENLLTYIFVEISDTTLASKASNCFTLTCVYYILSPRVIRPNKNEQNPIEKEEFMLKLM